MCAYIRNNSPTYKELLLPNAQWKIYSFLNSNSHTPMRNPVDRAIKAMTYGAGLVGLIVLIVFQLL
jgi:hypothetical protein